MDGMSLTIGGTLGAAIVSGIVKIYAAKRHADETKMPQPLVQEQTPSQALWKDNSRDHEDIFNRLRKNESAIATLMERSIAQGKTLDRMADQVSSLYDRIICGGGKRK